MSLPGVSVVTSRRGFATVLTAMIVLLSACGTNAADGAHEDTLVVDAYAELGDLVTIDPVGNHIPLPFSLVYDSLVRRDGKGELRPSLATSWAQTSPETWRFTLADGITFHDGSTFDAEDVAATIKHVIDPANSSGYLRFLRTVSAATVVNARTIDLTTSVPNGLLPTYLNQLPILSAAQLDASPDAYAKELLGTGPYEFESWKQGEKVVLRRYDKYWGTAGKYKTVELRSVSEPSTRLADLQTGSAGIISDLLPEQVDVLRASGATTVTEPAVKTTYLLIGQRGALANPRVRQALYRAIDRSALVKTIYGDLAAPAVSVVPKGFSGYADVFPLSDYNLDEARRLLAEAGVSTPVRAELNTTQAQAPVAELVREQARAVGFDLTVTIVPDAQLFDVKRVNAGSTPRIVLASALDNRMGDAYRPLETFFGAKAFAIDYGHTPRAENELRLQKYLATNDPAERTRLSEEIQRTSLIDVPGIWLFFPKTVFGIGKGTCYQPTGTGQFRIESVAPCP